MQILIGFKKLLLALILLLTVVWSATPQTAEAQVRRNLRANASTDEFFKFYCANVKVRPPDIEAFIRALQDLLASLQYVQLNLGSIQAQINPPSLCLPDFNFNVNIPGLEGLLACLSSFQVRVDVELSDTSGISSCLTGLIPQISLNLPNFNPNEMLNCLGNVNLQIDVGALALQIGNIIQALNSLIEALKAMLPKLMVTLSPEFLISLRWLNNYCKRNRARLR